jgi:hypothetical protein
MPVQEHFSACGAASLRKRSSCLGLLQDPIAVPNLLGDAFMLAQDLYLRLRLSADLSSTSASCRAEAGARGAASVRLSGWVRLLTREGLTWGLSRRLCRT